MGSCIQMERQSARSDICLSGIFGRKTTGVKWASTDKLNAAEMIELTVKSMEV